MIRFSLVVPTCGRPSLYEALHSALTSGLTLEDQVIVVGDGQQPEAHRIASFFEGRLTVEYHETKPTRCVGMFQRNYGMRLARGTHLCSFDDDDRYTTDAFRIMRRHVAKSPDRIHMFRIRAVAKRLPWDFVWKVPQVLESNVGSPTIVVPNDLSKVGSWGERYEGDFDFVRSTVELHDRPPIWHEEIIAEIR